LDNTLKVWDAATGAERTTLTGHTFYVNACAISPDGAFFVSASSDKTLKIWDAATGAEWATLRGHTSYVNACAISPDGAFIVSASDDKTLKVWDVATGAEQATLALVGPLTCLATHQSSPFAVCGDEGGGLHILNLLHFDYGPIIVTATLKRHWFTKEYLILCPSCQQEHSITKEQLGIELACLTPGCGLRMKINPFKIEMK
jgi:WD40 repeat protein